MKKYFLKISILCICTYLPAGYGQKILPVREITGEGVRYPGRKWVQKEFFLSTFSAVPGDSADYAKAVAGLKEAGFNCVETAWLPGHVTEAILQECDHQGMDVMAQDLTVVGGWHCGREQGELQPFHPDSVERFLQRYGTHPSLKSVYICDEPHPVDYDIIRKNIDELERRRPDLLGFSVLLPSYYEPFGWTETAQIRYDEYVDRYIAEVRPAVLSMDYYPFLLPADTTLERLNHSLFWKDMGLFRDRALQHKLPHWFYYQTVYISRDDFKPLILPACVTVQAWAAVMYGVKGLSTYTALGAVVDEKGEKAPLFDIQRKVNSELRALGPTLLHLKSTAVYHAEEAKIPDTYAVRPETSPWLAGLPEHVSAGEFTDSKNNTYILFLNRDFTAGREYTIPLKSMFRIYACDKNDNGKQSVLHEATDQLSLFLDAGEGVLVRIEQIVNNPKLIRYQIYN
jgi:hypothetical protein